MTNIHPCNKVMSLNLSYTDNNTASHNQPITTREVPETLTEPYNPTNAEAEKKLHIDENKQDPAPPELDGGHRR